MTRPEHLPATTSGEPETSSSTVYKAATLELADRIAPGDTILAPPVRKLLTRDRDLDRRNPTARTLKGDFGRFGLDLGSALGAKDVRSDLRLEALDIAVRLRNAIAHADEGQLGRLRDEGHRTRKRDVVRHRSKLDELAEDMDVVVTEHLATLFDTPEPW